MMLLDCAKLQLWTKQAAETWPGAWLHRFGGIPDEQVGSINREEWNVLDKYDHKTKLIHFTEGGPWLEGCEDHPYGDAAVHRAPTLVDLVIPIGDRARGPDEDVELARRVEQDRVVPVGVDDDVRL